MAKRYNTRAIKKNYAYDFEEAAGLLGVHVQTLRSWTLRGLPVLNQSRPYLLLGAHLQEFLDQRQINGKSPLKPNEMRCLKCSTSIIPAGNLADFQSGAGQTGRLIGICPTCDSLCNRFASEAGLPDIAPDLSIKFVTRQASLNEPKAPA